MQSSSNHAIASSPTQKLLLKHKTLLPVLGLLAITVLWFTINLPSLLTYPAPNSDESQIGGMSVQYLQSGGFHTPIFGEKVFEVNKNWRLYTVSLAGVFRIWGVGLAQARIFSFVGVLVGGWLLFALGHRLYGSQVGLISATLYLFSLRALWVSHIVRPDAWVNTASIASLLLFWLTKESRDKWLAFALGIFLAGTVDIYIVAIYSSLVIALAMLIEFRQKSGWNILRRFITGIVIGGAYWLSFQVFPNPSDMLTGWQGHLSASGVGTNSNSLSAIVINIIPSAIALLGQGLIGHSRLGSIEALYLCGGVITFGVRRNHADKFFLLMWAVLGVGQVVPYKGLWHIIDLLPLFSITMAVGAKSAGDGLIARFPKGEFLKLYSTMLISGMLIAGFVLGTASITNRSQVINYEQYARELRSIIPLNSSIFGEGTWWWGLRDSQFTSEEYARFYNDKKGRAASEFLHSILIERNIDVLLLDEFFSIYEYATNQDIQGAMTQYVTENCRLAGTVEGYAYGVEQGGPAIKRTRVYLCPTPQ